MRSGETIPHHEAAGLSETSVSAPKESAPVSGILMSGLTTALSSQILNGDNAPASAGRGVVVCGARCSDQPLCGVRGTYTG